MSYIYDGKFSGNILVVGRTACGKTGFVQKLAVNKFFGDIIKTEWVSYIKLDKKMEAEIQSCFDCQVGFYYPRNKDQFDNLLEYFKTKSSSSDEGLEDNEQEENDTHSDKNEVDIIYRNGFGEKSNWNRLIVMDDVSGLADTSVKFTSFLKVARKFKYHYLYIFHTIHPEKSIWKTILSQTSLLNIFPASVPIGTVKKLLEANCIRRTTKYIPVNFEKHPFEQLPITEEITFVDDDKHKADVPDTRKNLPPSTSEKNIPPYPPADPAPAESVKQRFVYAPTMAGIKQFDKKYKLPKQQKKAAKKQKSAEEIQAQKEKLEAELAENDLKMKVINKGKNISKKDV